MIFTSFSYLYFLLIVFTFYWALPNRKIQNSILLVASYIFYGWVHPWFCILIAFSTLLDYGCSLAMYNSPQHKKKFLLCSLIGDLGVLGVFKYYDFFISNIASILNSLGLAVELPLLKILLPVGISFYTFQALSYSIDVYRGVLVPRKNLFDVALYISCFPQLMAGPIERAKNILPQIEHQRIWSWERFNTAWPLIIRGFFKKLVIADNLAFYVDKVYMLKSPDVFLFIAGTLAYTFQIYMDFSGYTDIARGTARLFGFELLKNFNNPYFAYSPSDFWRRWHISLSTWIRDYIFISLGGSRHTNKSKNVITILITMFLCGLWHGAAWNYIAWGVFHGILLVIYQTLGFGGKWKPLLLYHKIIAWFVMFSLTMMGWSIFRASSIEWYWTVLKNIHLPENMQNIGVGMIILLNIAFFTFPLILFAILKKMKIKEQGIALYCGFFLVLILLYHNEGSQDFIYFQF